MRGAGAALLVGALLAAAAPPLAAPAAHRRDRALPLGASLERAPPLTVLDRAGAAEQGADGEEALHEALAAAAAAPAWRALWGGALPAPRPQLNTTTEHVLAQLGATAFLHCPVRHLADHGVSWVRRRDWHIISSSLFLYTNDERFQVLHAEGSDDWILQIKYVQKRDNGTYECQVASSEGVQSRLVELEVTVPEAFILGADEHHVHAGSVISLVCIIDKSPVPPQYVFWFHDERMINYDAALGVSVRTEPGAKTQSTLAIQRAAPPHSGNYSCRAPNTEPAYIYVYVDQGSDKMAATLSRSVASSPRLALAVPLAAPLAALLAALLSHALRVAPSR